MEYCALFDLKKNSKKCYYCKEYATMALMFEKGSFSGVGLIKALCDKHYITEFLENLSDRVLISEKLFIKNIYFHTSNEVTMYLNASFIFKQHILKDYTKQLTNVKFQY